MIEHCISFFQKENREKAYRIYVTDALKAIAENTTHVLTANGMEDYGIRLNHRWIDLVETPKEEPQEKKNEQSNLSCQEIANGIWERAMGGEN